MPLDNNIVTGTVASGITATMQTLRTLFGASSPIGEVAHFEDVVLINTGDADLYIALLPDSFFDTSGTPTTANAVKLEPDDGMTVEELGVTSTWVSTADAGATNRLQFKGIPLYKSR